MLHAHGPARHTQVLDSGWQIQASPLEQPDGLAPGDWQPVAVPDQWHLSALPNHAGVAWYQTVFTLAPVAPGLTPTLVFTGVDYACDVWLDGMWLGRHEGYFEPFEFAVEALGNEGPHVLSVRVAAPLEEAGPVWPYRKELIKGIFNHHDCRPGAWHPRFGQDGSTGGIWNTVQVEWRPVRYTERVRIEMHLAGDTATLLVEITTGGLPFHKSPTWSFEIDHVQGLGLEPGDSQAPLAPNDTSLAPNDTSFAMQDTSQVPERSPFVPRHQVKDARLIRLNERQFTLAFQLSDFERWSSWDVGEPHLYALKLTIDGDTSCHPFGLRTIERDGDNWLLNGQRLFLRGTNIIPAQYLSQYTPDQIAEDVRLMKAAGLNIVRVHAHVTRPEFYAACDQAGLMVWQDFALQWSYDPSPGFAAEATRQIRAMVGLLRAHPSIVAWCCHNEPVGQEHTLDPLLVKAVLQEDASRVIRSHSDFKEHPYPGWYYGERASFEALPGAPLITEFGAQALPAVATLATFLAPTDLWPPNWERWAYHDFQYEQTVWIAGVTPGDSLEDFVARSQAYQADLLSDAIDHYRRARFAPITGVFQFMFVDGWPSITWSVLDHLRRPKLGYFALQTAMSPVYVSLRLATPRQRSGLPLAIDVVIINDLPRAFDAAQLVLRLLDAGGALVKRWDFACDVPLDGLVAPTPVLKEALLTSPTWLGAFTLEASCLSADGEHLSTARRAVVLDALPAGLAEYKAVEML
jgi:beta-mannosidase